MVIQRFYKKAKSNSNKLNALKQISELVVGLDVEHCYNIESSKLQNEDERNLLKWIISSPFEKEDLSQESRLSENNFLIIEIGPR